MFSKELVGPPADSRDFPCSQFHTVLESVPSRAASDTVDGRCFVGMLQDAPMTRGCWTLV